MAGETSTQVMHVMDGNLRAQDNGRKRFIVTGTLGPLIVVVVLAASVQDRDGAKTTLAEHVSRQAGAVCLRR